MLFEPCWSCTRTNLLSLYLFLQINDDDDDDILRRANLLFHIDAAAGSIVPAVRYLRDRKIGKKERRIRNR